MHLGLYNMKYAVRRMMSGLLPAFRSVPPNLISWSILPVGIITAWLYAYADGYALFLLAGAALLLLRMFLATLDGLVAVTFHKSSPMGEIVNRVPSEISDVLLLVALTLSAPQRLVPGIAALAMGWLTTFSGLVGLTAGKPTQSIGPAGQTDRLAALIALSVAGYLARAVGHPFDAMNWLLLWVAGAGALTVILRLARNLRTNAPAQGQGKSEKQDQ